MIETLNTQLQQNLGRPVLSDKVEGNPSQFSHLGRHSGSGKS